MIRRRERSALSLAGGEGFPGRLEAKYRRKIAGETLMVNDLYVSLVYRPALGLASTWASKLLARSRTQEALLGIADAVEACDKLIETVSASLARYEPEQLKVYEYGWASPLAAFGVPELPRNTGAEAGTPAARTPQ